MGELVKRDPILKWCLHLQVVGLKYHDDLQNRIPRDEVQRAESIIRKAVMDILPSESIDDEKDPLYAYCMGSYLRGKPATGLSHLITSSHFLVADVVAVSASVPHEFARMTLKTP